MSKLRQALTDYLDIRRALGFELRSPARYLRTFVAFLEAQDASHITTAMAVHWATQPPDGAPAGQRRALYMGAEDAAHPPVRRVVSSERSAHRGA